MALENIAAGASEYASAPQLVGENMPGTTGVAVSKMPPPLSAEATWIRTKVIISFWAVILFLGIPMWWQTTTVHRARLPLTEMLDWSRGAACIPTFPLQIWISAPSMPCAEAKHLVHTTQYALDDLNEFPTHHLRLRLVECENKPGPASKIQGDEHAAEAVDSTEKGPALNLELVPERDSRSPSLGLRASSSKIVLQYPPYEAHITSKASSALVSYMAGSLHSIFLEEQASIAQKLISHFIPTNGAEILLSSVSHDVMSTIAKRETRSLDYASIYHLTFSLFTPGPAPSSWSIESALETHIQPWVAAFSAVSKFSITTQVQLYSSYSPSIQSFKDESSNGSFLRQDDVSAFVNAAEWPLSPSSGSGTTLNFVFYVPAKDQIPLAIWEGRGTSWLIPQWGGVTIVNPSLITNPDTGVLSLPTHLNAEELDAAFGTSAGQLLSLIGVPSTKHDNQMLPLALRLQSHTRLSALSLYLRASSTLGSLARLSQSLSSIPIPKNVADLVNDTMSHLRLSCQYLRAGYWNNALAHAQEAYEDSEKAFFEKSMVGQVYFPDEHKIAVYLPLLGPIGVPLVIGLIREIKRFVQSVRGP